MSRPDWQAKALCRSAAFTPGDFFFEGIHAKRSAAYLAASRRAKTICSMCPVRKECLDWALESDVRDGVWGGLTASERRRLRYPKRRVEDDGTVYEYPDVAL